MHVRTTYNACKSHKALTIRTELMNNSGSTQTLPIFDVLLWGGRGLVPFTPDKGRGFNHPGLDLSSTSAIFAAISHGPYFAAPGNDAPADGIMSHGKPSGAVSYGLQSISTVKDSNGKDPGGTLTTLNLAATTSLHASLLSAASNGIPGPSIPNGASEIYTRRLVVANRNDAAAVIGDKANTDSILLNGPLSGVLGTVSGSFAPASTAEGTVTFVRTGGPDLAAVNAAYASLNSAPVSEVRCKGTFKNVLLPEGTYTLRAIFPGRDEVIKTGITVAVGANTAITPAIALPKTGKIKVEVHDADTTIGVPSKVSLSPSPLMRREFTAYSYSLDLRCSNSVATSCAIVPCGGGMGTCGAAGMCSNNFSTPCFTDVQCGAGNTCFRQCSNVEPIPCGAGCTGAFSCASDGFCRKHACNADTDCDESGLCVADTASILPESYPGGQAQGAVIYTDKKGKAIVEVKPGTYSATISRGLEYTIDKVTPVTITAGATTDLGIQTIKRVVDTSNFLSADFHIHSGRSLDSSAPLEARVRSFAGEGLEVMVSTDHDTNTDYSPVIKKLGMNPFITSVVGTEVTTSVPEPPYLSNGWGHINSWPSVYNPTARRGGSVEDESVSANEIYDRLRAQSDTQCVGGKKNTLPCSVSGDCPGGACVNVGEQVVQMNHPRAGVSGVVNIGLFDNIGFDPSKSIDNCQKYPVVCASSACNGGTNDGFTCTTDAQCTGGGKCSCGGGSIPGATNGCNDILNDLNVVPQGTLCTAAGCGSGFEDPNGTRNIDFDMMEIDNSGTAGSYNDLRMVRRDWMSILNQGIQVGKATNRHQLWGTGVSDSHRIVQEIPAYSRTYVEAGEFPVSPALLNINSFDQEVLGGHMTVTTGPYITLTADNGGAPVDIGDTLTGPANVNLHIEVQAAPWIPVDEVRIVKNGCVLACFNNSTVPAVSANPVNPYEQVATNVTRFSATVPDTVTEDSYYIVEASPNLPTPPNQPSVDPIVDSVASGIFTYGFTNPIFVDFDSSGAYDGITLSPGSGEPTCPALPPACSGGAITQAAAPAITMFAKAASPAAQPKGLLARLFGGFAQPAAADADAPVATSDERAQKREQELRKPSQDHVPWRLIEFPTPRPDQITPTADAPAPQ